MPYRRLGWWLVSAAALTNLGLASADLRLVEAVKAGDLAATNRLILERVDVSAAAADGATALHWAAQRGDLATATALITAGANVDAATRHGVTPLSLACLNGSSRIVEALLEAGADPNAAFSAGETPLMTASRAGALDAVKALLAHGADANARESWRGQTALMWALAEQHLEVAQTLIEYGADVRARSTGGFNPLLFAAQQGDSDAVRLLLAAGADVNDASPHGSALHVATVSGHVALATMLLERGADPNAHQPGYAPMHWVAGSWETRLTGTSGVQDASYQVAGGLQHGRIELVRALLDRGADPNARIVKDPPRYGYTLFQSSSLMRNLSGATPFLLAAMTGDVDLMRLLLEAGADPALQTTDHTTALMLASGLAWAAEESRVTERSAIAAVTFLLELGDVRAANDAGQTALHGAASRGADHVVRLLIQRGADVNVRNKRGLTPMDIAEGYAGGLIRGAHKSTVELLRDLGGRPGRDAAPSGEARRSSQEPSGTSVGGVRP